MMRLLRGRVFYLGLILFVLGLVILGRPMQSETVFLSPELSMMDGAESPEEWWKEGIDPEIVNAAAERDPVLRLILLTLSLVTVSLCLGGGVIFIWGLATGSLNRIWKGPWHKLPRWTLGEFWRIAVLVVMIGIMLSFVHVALIHLWPNLPLDTNLWVNISMLMLHAFLLLIAGAFAADKFRPGWKAFGFSKRHSGKAISAGLRGYMAIFPWLLLLLFLVVKAASWAHYDPPTQPIQEMIFVEERSFVLGLTVLLTCLVGPVAEEVFFRGIFFSALRQRMGRWPAMLASGIFFSFVHTNVIGFVPILVLGCFLADLYERTGSLSAPIAIHMVHNTFLLMVALTYRMAV